MDLTLVGVMLIIGLGLSALAWKIPGGARFLYAIGTIYLGYIIYEEKGDALATFLFLAAPFLALGLLWYGQMVRGAVLLLLPFLAYCSFTLDHELRFAILGGFIGLIFLFRKKFEHPFWEGLWMKVKRS